MNFRISFLLVISIFLARASYAQDNDYLKHNKVFYLCSFKRVCSNCYDCNKGRYLVKIENRVGKKITKVSYKFYSSVYNRILEKDAKIEGDVIDPKHIGLLYICVPEGDHWIVSNITYDDGTSNTFKLGERMDNFQQEPDECDCSE